ncbi:hypothetical protein BC567DRAFT_237774 [Phyllosticta citribraziliensis]
MTGALPTTIHNTTTKATTRAVLPFFHPSAGLPPITGQPTGLAGPPNSARHEHITGVTETKSAGVSRAWESVSDDDDAGVLKAWGFVFLFILEIFLVTTNPVLEIFFFSLSFFFLPLFQHFVLIMSHLARRWAVLVPILRATRAWAEVGFRSGTGSARRTTTALASLNAVMSRLYSFCYPLHVLEISGRNDGGRAASARRAQSPRIKLWTWFVVWDVM